MGSVPGFVLIIVIPEQTMVEEIYQRAQIFARALDANDFEKARMLLAPDCVYDTGREILTGPDAIMSSYANNNEKAHTLFDFVAYESEILETTGNTALILFTDKISRQGQNHIHSCNQRLHFAADLKIEKIEHLEIKGENARLLEYLASCGK